MSELNEREVEWLRDAFAERSPDADVEHPVAPERLWDAVGGELDGEQAAALVDRIAAEPALAEEWRLAVAARQEMERADADETVDDEPRSMGWGWLIAAAAAVVLVWAVMPEGAAPTEPSTTPQIRGGADGAQWGATSEARTLRWEAVPDAIGYRVLVFGPDMTPLHETASSQAPEATVPESIRGPAFWRVEVELRDRSVQHSPLFEVTLD